MGNSLKKRFIIIGATAVLLTAGGYIGYQYAIDVAAEKLAEQLSDDAFALMDELEAELPEASAAIEAAAGESSAPAAGGAADDGASGQTETSGGEDSAAGGAGSAAGQTSGQSSGGAASDDQPSDSNGAEGEPTFNSKEEAVKFAITRFSASEINRLRKMAGDGLTDEEKQELKQIAFSKFTKEEIEAVRQAVTNK